MNIRIILLLPILTLAQYLFGQQYDLYHGHQVFAKTVIVKLDIRPHLKSAPVRPSVTELDRLLQITGASPLKQMFPRSIPPQNDNEVDISTIYQFTYTADIPVQQLVDAIARMPQVLYAQPEFVHELFYVPNDTRISQQYHHKVIHSFEAWDTFGSDSAIVIGITDTGCDIAHEDLSGSIAYNYDDPINGIDDDNDGYIDNFRGWDFGDNDNNPSVGTSDHGTWVAGLAAAAADNKLGVAGTSFGAKFLPVKISTDGGVMRNTWTSVVYAADHGCQIINCSWGSKYKEPLGEDVVNYATFNRNSLVIAAAGNNSTQEEYYPASFRNALSVAGTVENDQKWSKSNSQSSSGSSWGYYVDVTAPAAGYYSTANNNSYTFMYGGTSFAAPIVSGVAALVKTAFPNLSAIALGEQIKAQSDKIDTIAFNLPYEDMLGTGRVNAESAVSKFNRPGIRYTNYSLSSNKILRPGDTVSLTVNLANYLAAADSLIVAAEFNSKFISLISSTHTIRNFASGDTVSGTTFRFSFSDALPLDFEARVKLIYISGNYRAYEYITIPANPSSKELVTKQARIALPSNGRIGFTATDAAAGGISALNNEELIGEAGLFFAEATNRCASSFLGRKDFIVTEQTMPCSDDSSQYCFSSRYRADLLELNVKQTVRGWDDSTYFLIDYSITNTSVLEKPNLITGNYWDWNVLGGWNNYTGYHSPTGLSYTYSTEPGTIYIGTMLVGTDSANTFVTDPYLSSSNAPNIANDNSDKVIYACATTWLPERRYKILGSNTSVVQSSVPRYIGNGDTIHHRVAIVFADTYEQMIAQAERLHAKTELPQNTAHTIAPEHLHIYPTVTSDAVYITGIADARNAAISLHSIEGQPIKINWTDEQNFVKVSMSQLPQGVYIMSVRNDDRLQTAVIVRQ